MTTCMTPKLKGMAQTPGGKVPRMYRSPEVAGQGEPTPDRPIHAHKTLAGADAGMKRIKGVG
jgi:hypothetical protein